MHLYDTNARIQLAREHADELARDARRVAKAPAREPRRAEQAERASLASRLNRLRRRRPAPAA
jgi:hypothetical protein